MLDMIPSPEKLLAINSHDYAPEEFKLVDRTIYFYSPKGYGTAKHLAALREYGPSPYHRRTFAPVRALL